MYVLVFIFPRSLVVVTLGYKKQVKGNDYQLDNFVCRQELNTPNLFNPCTI